MVTNLLIYKSNIAQLITPDKWNALIIANAENHVDGNKEIRQKNKQLFFAA